MVGLHSPMSSRESTPFLYLLTSDRARESLGFPSQASPRGFKKHLLGEGFHTLINGVLFSSPTDVGHHTSPPSRPVVLVGTLSLLQSMWDCHQIYPFWGQCSYWHTASCLPLRKTERKLTHCSVSGFDTICNGP